jgi:host factor-I protein
VEDAMSDEGGNLQNDFFNHARKDRRTVAIVLTNGKRLNGRIKAFDKFTLLLEGPHGELMVFKHAIATVSASADHEAWMQPDDESLHRDDAAGKSGRPAARND